MTLIVTINKPQYEDGVPLEVRGLGVFNNRVPTEITEDGERDYARYFGKIVTEGLASEADFTISGTPILTGNLVDVIGYDPADQSYLSEPGTGFDTSPATSLGETIENQQVVTPTTAVTESPTIPDAKVSDPTVVVQPSAPPAGNVINLGSDDTDPTHES
jgi:hypothetical protein